MFNGDGSWSAKCNISEEQTYINFCVSVSPCCYFVRKEPIIENLLKLTPLPPPPVPRLL